MYRYRNPPASASRPLATARLLGPPALALLLCLTPTLPATTGGVSNLPDLGSKAERALTPQMQRKISRAYLRRLRRRMLDDPLVATYLWDMGARLVTQNNRNLEDFHFVLINDTRINAFAAPGGLIGINAGVILNAETESEVAAVMAHEIAHVTQEHLARAYGKRGNITLQQLGTVLGAILLSGIDPELGQAAVAIGTAGSLQYQINYTRSNEEEADRIGMQILHAADYDPQGMPGFFGRLLRASSYQSSILPEYLRTHPLTQNRVADSATRADAFEPMEYTSSLDFELMKTRLLLARQSGAQAAVRYFRDKLEGRQDSLSPAQLTGTRYGYALSLLQADEFAPALEQIDVLLADHGGHLCFLLAAAKAELGRGRGQASLDLLEQAARLHPEHPQPALWKAEVLLRAEQPAQAVRTLRDYGRLRANLDVDYYKALAKAEEADGNAPAAQLAQAHVSYQEGSTKKAIKQLRSALQIPSLSNYDRQRISARLEEFEQEAALEKRLRL